MEISIRTKMPAAHMELWPKQIRVFTHTTAGDKTQASSNRRLAEGKIPHSIISAERAAIRIIRAVIWPVNSEHSPDIGLISTASRRRRDLSVGVDRAHSQKKQKYEHWHFRNKSHV